MKLNSDQQKLVEGNIRLVHWFDRKKSRPIGIDPDDLISEYMEALCIAAIRWKSGEGRSFQNYAIHAMDFRRKKIVRKNNSLKRGGSLKIFTISSVLGEGDGFERGQSEPEFLGVVFDDKLELMEEHKVLNEAVSRLNRRERAVFRARMRGKTFKEMAEGLTRNKERLRQVYKDAEGRVRRFVLKRFA